MGRALVVTAGIIGHREESALRSWTERSQEKKKKQVRSPTTIQCKESLGKQVWEGRWQIHNELI